MRLEKTAYRGAHCRCPYPQWPALAGLGSSLEGSDVYRHAREARIYKHVQAAIFRMRKIIRWQAALGTERSGRRAREYAGECRRLHI